MKLVRTFLISADLPFALVFLEDSLSVVRGAWQSMVATGQPTDIRIVPADNPAASGTLFINACRHGTVSIFSEDEDGQWGLKQMWTTAYPAMRRPPESNYVLADLGYWSIGVLSARQAKVIEHEDGALGFEIDMSPLEPHHTL